jgi:hypothetical protein
MPEEAHCNMLDSGRRKLDIKRSSGIRDRALGKN